LNGIPKFIHEMTLDLDSNPTTGMYYPIPFFILLGVSLLRRVRLSAAIPPGFINGITFCFTGFRRRDKSRLYKIHSRCGISAAILYAAGFHFVFIEAVLAPWFCLCHLS